MGRRVPRVAFQSPTRMARWLGRGMPWFAHHSSVALPNGWAASVDIRTLARRKLAGTKKKNPAIFLKNIVQHVKSVGEHVDVHVQTISWLVVYGMAQLRTSMRLAFWWLAFSGFLSSSGLRTKDWRSKLE